MPFTNSFDARKITGAIKKNAEKAAFMGAQHLRKEAVELTPVDTGTLRNSAKVTADGNQAAVSYSTPYAARQHEEVGWNHPEGGQAKFLETAMINEAPTIARIIANTITKGLK
ncbi:HK97 gp10 family phage protein [Corynebacterium hindlerae]|uniref:HK97 gp10 family phage protein n=1 Tax=Corynebacterium hindlerae TaxID=699041 RepID=A0A7G5FBV2_9CORY|nr:minor capsid protein [Corynebacterium hindlerae]QMV84093.1 HK97 gp10 family phage protein [Corynebacterium hindlerae]